MKKKLLLFALSLLSYLPLSAQYISDIHVSSDVTLGTGNVSPFWFNVNQHGLNSIQPNSAYVRAGISKEWNTAKRFDYAYGTDFVAAYNLDADLIVQQLYADIKYRSLFLSVGSKERTGLFRNPLLSTGGTLWSGNARPIPQVRLGFHDWVKPFRADWFALKGDFSYGWFTDQRFQKNFIDKRDGVYVKDIIYHHKYIAFKFGTDETRFKVEAAYEIDQQFGGKRIHYKNNEVIKTEQIPSKLKDYIRAFFPLGGSSDDLETNSQYYQGNYVGEWQVNLHYRLNSEHRFRAGFENFWEDASAMGKFNRMDGLWSLEYTRTSPALISGALIEYFQSTDGSGPIHWCPSFTGQDTNIKYEAYGADGYYSHGVYGSWSHWGQNIGNPLIPSPAFNENGSLSPRCNRVKSWNLGVNGQITPEWHYRILLTHMRGWGTYGSPFKEVEKNLSGMLEVSYLPKWQPRLSFKLATAFNTGNLYGGEAWGTQLAVTYQFLK